ncbi:MAG: arginine deiminase-related protein [Saprospiraceae bacterium]|nr:arginine deiminase-related protein [Saprospiraceae bacterium]
MESTSTVFLIRPHSFSHNIQTAKSNVFQNDLNEKDNIIQQKALIEFENFVKKLKSIGIEVEVFDDNQVPVKPDAIFPNNWISFHANSTIILYPLCTLNRRPERRSEIINNLKLKYQITNLVDLSFYEKEGKFLEGTGSIVFDHKNKIAYACLSPRTDQMVFEHCAKILGYKAISFHAYDENKVEIYHTNVMMNIGEGFAVICLESISSTTERKTILRSLIESGHEIIEIDFQQMSNFAGNMLALSVNNNQILVLSEKAMHCLTSNQIKKLKKYCNLLPVSIPTIETVGGGSARCMICEIFY